MSNDDMLKIKNLTLAPYIQLAISLIDKPRQAGGNTFRHQLDTFTILVDYGYCDAVLLKASVIHDVIEDIPGFDQNIIRNIDNEGNAVLALALEVSKKVGETKANFLTRIKNNGSLKAKILKCADRISNVISLGLVIDLKFVERYIKETEKYIYPIAEEVNVYMLQELKDLVKSRYILLGKEENK